MRRSEFNVRPRYAVWFVMGLIMFVGAPEGIRLFNGGAIAQQSLIPNNTIIGNTITGPSSFSATSGPGQSGPVVAASQMLQFAQARMAKRRMQLALTLRQEVA
jgi:hypothetical protein